MQNADGFWDRAERGWVLICGQNADGFCAVFRTRMGSELGGGSREQDCLKVAIRNRQYVRPVIRNDVDSRPNRSVALIEIVIQVRWHSVRQEAIHRGSKWCANGGIRVWEKDDQRRDLTEIAIQVMTIKIH